MTENQDSGSAVAGETDGELMTPVRTSVISAPARATSDTPLTGVRCPAEDEEPEEVEPDPPLTGSSTCS